MENLQKELEKIIEKNKKDCVNPKTAFSKESKSGIAENKRYVRRKKKSPSA